jgi:DNA-binding FadR family transcriptional regulator
MKEKNLLAELAAYLFSHSDKGTGRTPSERELAEHFGVSRGQIREALAILEAMRIVERRAKSGIYIDTKQASVEAMALFARAGLPLDPIQIYEALLRRDGNLAQALMSAHLQGAESYWKGLIEGRGAEPRSPALEQV